MTSCPVWGYRNFRPIKSKIKRYVLLLCLNAAGLLTRLDGETSEKTRHITSLFIEPRSIFQPQLFNRIWDKNNTDHVPTRHYSAGKSCLHGMQSDAVIHPNTLTDQAPTPVSPAHPDDPGPAAGQRELPRHINSSGNGPRNVTSSARSPSALKCCASKLIKLRWTRLKTTAPGVLLA